MANCSNCGHGLNESAKFCVECGTPVTLSTQTKPTFEKPSYANKSENDIPQQAAEVYAPKQETAEKPSTQAPSYSAPSYSAPRYTQTPIAGASNTQQPTNYTSGAPSFVAQSAKTGEFNSYTQPLAEKPPVSSFQSTYTPPSANPVPDANATTSANTQVPNTQVPNAPPLAQAPKSINNPPAGTNVPSYTQPAQGTSAKKTSTGKIIAIVACVALVMAVLFGILIFVVSNIFAGAQSNNENDGTWTAIEIDFMGIALSPDELFDTALVLELEGNEYTLLLEGETHSGIWSQNGTEIILEDDFYGTINDDIIIIQNVLDLGFNIVFLRDGAPMPETYAEGGSYNGGFVDDLFGNESDTAESDVAEGGFVAPGYGAEDTVLATEITNPSDWYGTVTISDYNGDNDWLTGEHEAWGYIGTDSAGTEYFEVFIDGPYDDDNSIVLFSYYMYTEGNTIYPIIDDEAWILDADLQAADSILFAPTLENGILSSSYDYHFGLERFSMTYEVAQIDR